MANSWNGPQLGSPIRTDVPELQKKLIALLKGDPTSVADIPSGAKRLVNTSDVQWQVQQYNGSSWAAIGKLMHDVDKLDGYHAAITPAASTIAVRNADKKLEGDITGNAATASSAATLSETLPVNKGGTGATTSAQARTNLGVPPTSHASSSTTYGLATDANYGHVRSDGDTTNIVAGEVVAKDIAIGGDSTDLASVRGQIGDVNQLDITDFNSATDSGAYMIKTVTMATAANKPPITRGGHLVVYSYKNETYTYIRQIFFVYNSTTFYSRYYTEGTWGVWAEVITSSGGVMEDGKDLIVSVRKQTDNTSPVQIAFGVHAKGIDGTVRNLYPFFFVPGDENGDGLVIHTRGGMLVIGSGESPLTVARGLVAEGLTGARETTYFTSDNSFEFLYGQNEGYDKSKSLSVYSTGVMNLSAEHPRFGCTELSYDRLETLTENKDLFSHLVYDKNGARVAGLYNIKYTNGVTKYGILTYAHGVSKNVYSEVCSCIDKDGNKWGEAPTPPSDSNTNHMATTKWVRDRHVISTTVPTSDQGTDGDIWYRY